MNLHSSLHTYITTAVILTAIVVTNIRMSAAFGDSELFVKNAPAELSVAPANYSQYSPPKPSWVDASPGRAGDVYQIPVESILQKSESLCEEALRVAMRAAVESYVESLVDTEDAETVVMLDDEWIDRHRDKRKNYLGVIEKGGETLYVLATQLNFTGEDDAMIRRASARLQKSRRLGELGFLSLTAVVFLISGAAALSIVTRRAEQRVAMPS